MKIRIKYDRHDQKLTLSAATACTILAALAALMVHLPDSPLDHVSDYAAVFAIRFQKLGSEAWLFDVCMFGVCVCWFIAALVYRRQMRPDLYRDDVVIDTSGKVRQNIVMGMFSIVFGAFVSEFVFYMMWMA